METKKKMPIWKKILFGIGIFIALIFVLSLLFPIDYYKQGLDYYKKQDYKKAFSYFNRVASSDKNYNDAIDKIEQLKPIVDSINKAAEIAKNKKQESKDNIKTEKERAVDNSNSTNETKSSSTNGLKGVVGTSYDLGSLTYKVERVKFKKFIGGLYTLKKAGGIFLIITLTVINKEKEQIIIDNSYFKLVDENGAVYKYSLDASTTLEVTQFPGETFMGMTINPNVSKKAKVVFEVPTKKKNYKLIFQKPFSTEFLEFDMNEQ